MEERKVEREGGGDVMRIEIGNISIARIPTSGS